MRTIFLLVLSCVSVFAADTNEIHAFSWTYKVLPENSLATIEVFTRGGQTNLIRKTHTKDGVVSLRTHSFFHNGIQAGSYMYETANRTNTGIGSTAGSPFYFNVNLNASNQPTSAQIRATNLALLDWFPCTNGIFYPADQSLIDDANTRLPKLPAQ